MRTTWRSARPLAAERGDVVYPGHPELPQVHRGALDDEWLPVIGTERLVVITRDRKIRYRPAEKLAWVEHEVRGFVLTGRKSQGTADSLQILRRHWGRRSTPWLEEEPEGPWMRAITEASLRVIDLT